MCSSSLIQGIFPTQESNPGLLHWRQILYQLSYQGSPKILEWVTYPFSRKSSQPRNPTRISCLAGGFFTSWTIREALTMLNLCRLLQKCETKKYINKVKTYSNKEYKKKTTVLKLWSYLSTICTKTGTELFSFFPPGNSWI